jgi:hypothetical protein
MEQSIGLNLMDSQSLRAMATLNHPLAHPPSAHTRRQGDRCSCRMCTGRVALRCHACPSWDVGGPRGLNHLQCPLTRLVVDQRSIPEDQHPVSGLIGVDRRAHRAPSQRRRHPAAATCRKSVSLNINSIDQSTPGKYLAITPTNQRRTNGVP